MYFVLKTAFWLSLVILLIPADPETAEDTGNPDISSLQAISAAQQAYVDMTRFCERSPLACETGSAAVEMFGAKARTGARMVYEYLDPAREGARNTAGSEAVSAAPSKASTRTDEAVLHTGSTRADPAHGTLTPADRQPEWVPPAPTRKPV